MESAENECTGPLQIGHTSDGLNDQITCNCTLPDIYFFE